MNEILEQLPNNHRVYLETLKADIVKANQIRRFSMAKEYRSVATGYIKCLVDCGVIDEFKPLWCWFNS